MKRQDFTKATKRQAWDRANGMCECHRLHAAGVPGFKAAGCYQMLGPVGNIYYEHIIVDRAGGKPTLDNCAVLTRACWKLKTATYDMPLAAKVRRQEDMARGIR